MNIKDLYTEKNIDAVPEILSSKDLVERIDPSSLQGLIQVANKEILLDDNILNWLLINHKISVQIEIPEFLTGEKELLINLKPVAQGNYFIGEIHSSVYDNYRECSVFGWMTKDNFTASEMDKNARVCRVAKFFSNLSTNPLRDSIYDTFSGGKKANPEVKEFLDTLNALKAESDDLYIEAVSESLAAADTPPSQIAEWVLRFKTERAVFRGEIPFDEAKQLEIEFKAKPPLRLNTLTVYKTKVKTNEFDIDPAFIQKLKDLDIVFLETEDGGRWNNWAKLEQEDRDYLLKGSNSSKIRVMPGMTRKA